MQNFFIFCPCLFIYTMNCTNWAMHHHSNPSSHPYHPHPSSSQAPLSYQNCPKLALTFSHELRRQRDLLWQLGPQAGQSTCCYLSTLLAIMSHSQKDFSSQAQLTGGPVYQTATLKGKMAPCLF